METGVHGGSRPGDHRKFAKSTLKVAQKVGPAGFDALAGYLPATKRL